MENEIVMIHSETDLRSKIYTIRGIQVMLDFDLAEIYGYSVKAFNQQVKNNIEKFDEDFRFQVTWEELEKISLIRSRSKILTLNTGRGSNIKYKPYAFTEQGIYMLMTVLRGDFFVIDNYISLKTLVLLKSVPENLKITIFTDNLKKGLHQKEFDDFCKEYPKVVISFKRTNGIFHDRYIIIDFGTENEIIYHCGASSKDAGSRVCSITTITDNEIYKPLIENLLKNQAFIL